MNKYSQLFMTKEFVVKYLYPPNEAIKKINNKQVWEKIALADEKLWIHKFVTKFFEDLKNE